MTVSWIDPLAHTTPQTINCPIIDKTWLAPHIVRLRFESESLSPLFQPGQFVNIKVSEQYIPLLRRPFSVHRVDPKGLWFEILVQVIGQGTARLAQYEVGDSISILGPLGNRFSIPKRCSEAILLAGGLGIAPLLFLAQVLHQRHIPTRLFYGNKSHSNICCLEDFAALEIPYLLATDDGSRGFKGTVIDLFSQQQHQIQSPAPVIYACGPNPMFRQLQPLAARLGWICQVSLETMMACGFGACLGCVVDSNDPSDPYKYVCKDGPVFNINEIDFRE